MNQELKRFIVFGVAIALTMIGQRVEAADDPAPNAVRTVLQFARTECSGDAKPFRDLVANYFANSGLFEKALAAVLNDCHVNTDPGSYLVVHFTASPTLGAEAPTVIHAIYRQEKGSSWRRVGGLLGVSKATWVFLTDDVCDSVKGETLTSRVEHPALAQLGPFASALIGKFPGQIRTLKGGGGGSPAPCTLTDKVYVHTASGNIAYKRGAINETLYVQRIHRTADRKAYLTPEGKETTDVADAAWAQLAESSSFSNTPLTQFTFNAGAAIFTGNTGGAQQMAIEEGKFVSDPTPRAATLAGVTWHAKYDGTTAEPSRREKHGFFTGAVLTPSAGLAVAYTYGWRGFSLLGGFGVMWVKSAQNNERLNTPVVDNEGLVRRPTYGLILGGSYAFGG